MDNKECHITNAEYKGHQIIFNDIDHTYLVDGVPTPSVTTIIKEILPDMYNNVPKRVLEKASVFGTKLHKATEIGSNEALNGTYENLAYREYNILLEKEDITPLKQEVFVCYDNPDYPNNGLPKVLFVGQTDMIGIVRGQRCLLDKKFTSKYHKEYLDWQLSMYELACYEEFSKLLCIHVPKGSIGRLYESDRIPKELIMEKLEEFYKKKENTKEKEIIMTKETVKKEKEVINTSELNLYQKIQKCRVELQNSNLKKTGDNKFAGFKYYELADFLPKLNELLDKYKLFSHFTLTNDVATLEIFDTENIKNEYYDSITFSIPVAEITIKGANAIQNLGGVNTYLKRYLYLNAFEIVESDLFDATSGKTKKAVKLIDMVQIGIINQYYSGDDMTKLLNVNKLNKLEEMTYDKAEEIINKLNGLSRRDK